MKQAGSREAPDGAWTEVNIEPADIRQLEEVLLLQVVAPVVQDVVAYRGQAWFFSGEREPVGRFHLRLRIWWHPGEQEAGDAEVTALLDKAERDGKTGIWWPGRHGVPGGTYEGEEAEYGDLWRLVATGWMSGCQLALGIAATEPDGLATALRYHHWSRRLHMFSNALGLGYFYEGYWCLHQGAGYLAEAVKVGDPRAKDQGVAGAVNAAGKASRGMRDALRRREARLRKERGVV
jgi:hypothetical protein